MKKILSILGVLVVCLALVGCSKEKNVEGNLEDIMAKLYTDISDDEKPMMLSNIPLTTENFENFAFIKDIKYKEALASESQVGSIPHSVVLIRLENASDSQKVKEEIEKNANPAKWICVSAENVIVKTKGDLVVLIMSNDLASKIATNFDNL